MRKSLSISSYAYSTWTKQGFKQVCLIPSIFLVHSTNGEYSVDSDEYSDLYVLSISFLIWDIGIQIFKIKK